jgi:glycerol-3-phosphate acyltransferase PlsY
MLELGLKVFISYLIGSLNGSLIVGRMSGGVDIRQVGSGNAGGTNALRTQGKMFAFWVILIDVGKGSLPTWLLPGLALPWIGLDPEVSRTWLTYGVGGAVIVGHCYPVWFRFAGGKGAATAIGVLAIIAPLLLLPMAVTWVLVLILSGYVGLATICAAVVIPVYVAFTALPEGMDLLVFTTLLAMFAVFTHRSNIQRILSGDEERDMQSSWRSRTR